MLKPCVWTDRLVMDTCFVESAHLSLFTFHRANSSKAKRSTSVDVAYFLDQWIKFAFMFHVCPFRRGLNLCHNFAAFEKFKAFGLAPPPPACHPPPPIAGQVTTHNVNPLSTTDMSSPLWFDLSPPSAWRWWLQSTMAIGAKSLVFPLSQTPGLNRGVRSRDEMALPFPFPACISFVVQTWF